MCLAAALQDLEVAQGCFRHLRALFLELEETRPFELLKGQVRLGLQKSYRVFHFMLWIGTEVAVMCVMLLHVTLAMVSLHKQQSMGAPCAQGRCGPFQGPGGAL
jgi:hypothetical protein